MFDAQDSMAAIAIGRVHGILGGGIAEASNNP